MPPRKIQDKPKVRRRFVRGAGLPAKVDRVAYGKDTPQNLVRAIRSRTLDPRSLSKEQRQACLMVLANGTETSNELGELFGVTGTRIRADLKEIRRRVGREVREWTLDEVIGDLAIAHDRYAARALKQEDVGLAWAIKKDFANLLHKFGIVGDAERESGLRVTIETIGASHDRLRTQLARALDPAITGEVIDVSPSTGSPALPLREVGPDQPDREPPPVLVEEVDGQDHQTGVDPEDLDALDDQDGPEALDDQEGASPWPRVG